MAQRCRAKAKSTGERCARYAIEGGTTCRVHGGASKGAKAAAARRIAAGKAAKAMRLFAEPETVDPSQALLDLVHWTAGEVTYWRAQVRALAEESADALTWSKTRHEEGVGVGSEGGYGSKDVEEAAPHVAYAMLSAAQDRLAKYATAALRAGVEERRVKLAEQQGELVAGAIRAILADLQLTAEQSARVPEVVPRHLRLLAG